MSNSTHTFDIWLAALKSDIGTRGLAAVWSDRFPEISAQNQLGGGDLLGQNLYDLVTADPTLKAALDAKGATPRAQREERQARLKAALDAKGATPGTSSSSLAQATNHRGFVDSVRAALSKSTDMIDGLIEADGSPIKVLKGVQFQNWGRTVSNVPALTAVPISKIGVCNLVKWAAANGKSIRAAGYRHTWGDLYSGDQQVLISFLPLDVVEDLPAQEPAIDPANALQGIKVVGTIVENGQTKALCRIGAATTNEQFRRWCLNDGGGALDWTVPFNVIMVEITWGGSNAPICHGAGLKNQTLSDLVTEIEFVNPLGVLQVVNDPAELKAASGAFGLMGIVTSITLKLDPMTYAEMTPEKRRVALTIPPPAGFKVPAGVDMSGVTQTDMDHAFSDFVNRAESAYYAEWFWFTFQDKCWINTWKNTGDKAHSQDYPGELGSAIQAAEEYTAGLMNESWVFNQLSEKWQAELLGSGAMSFLPSDQTIVTPLIDGLHFRRGIQNMRVFDMEWEIPIPARADDPTKPDWTICQKAWWDAIAEVYRWFDTTGKVPMRLTLEMRIMGASGVTMAPQYGNRFGTCSIEALTTINTDRADWKQFMQDVTNRWTAYTDARGNALNTRPHWAKEWQRLEVAGVPISDYLRDTAYKDRIPEFGKVLHAIATRGGYSMADMKARFGNTSLTQIFSSIYV